MHWCRMHAHEDLHLGSRVWWVYAHTFHWQLTRHFPHSPPSTLCHPCTHADLDATPALLHAPAPMRVHFNKRWTSRAGFQVRRGWTVDFRAHNPCNSISYSYYYARYLVLHRNERSETKVVGGPVWLSSSLLVVSSIPGPRADLNFHVTHHMTSGTPKMPSQSHSDETENDLDLDPARQPYPAPP
jgi:hypothetical protein